MNVSHSRAAFKADTVNLRLAEAADPRLLHDLIRTGRLTRLQRNAVEVFRDDRLAYLVRRAKRCEPGEQPPRSRKPSGSNVILSSDRYINLQALLSAETLDVLLALTGEDSPLPSPTFDQIITAVNILVRAYRL